jgi:hypothetical protein
VDLRTGAPAADDPVTNTGWGPERTVRAAVIAAVLLGASPAQPGAVASLRLAGARITGPLDLAGARIDHMLWLKECRLEEPLGLRGAATSTLRVVRSRLPELNAGLARIEGSLDLTESVLDAGRLQLQNAAVTGELDLYGARISGRGGWAVFAGGLEMGGRIFCTGGFSAYGGLRFVGAQVPGGLELAGARIIRPGGVALCADNASISALDFSQGFAAEGRIELPGARISDLLTFAGADLGKTTAIVCHRTQAGDFDFTPARPPAGPVDLRGAQVTTLHDSARSWPREVRLEGFGYGSLASDRTAGREDTDVRIAWLARTPGYAPQPYEQLAAVYRGVGHDDEARRVLLAKQRRRRRTLGFGGRVWGRLLDVTVGYGYRPWLAGLWLAALTLAGSQVFRVGEREPVRPGENPDFHPVVYTLDLLIPIGGFGQRDAWQWAAGGQQTLAYALIATGWILTTAVLAGVTRTLSKN